MAVSEINESGLPPAVVVQRRRQLRKKTFLGGIIVSCDGTRTVDCVIRDLSDNGARIKVPSRQPIPKRAYLIISGKEAAYEIMVVRSLTDEFGLQILATHAGEELKRPDLTFLRRLVVERLPRAHIA
jgi:hypothetical protein